MFLLAILNCIAWLNWAPYTTGVDKVRSTECSHLREVKGSGRAGDGVHQSLFRETASLEGQSRKECCGSTLGERFSGVYDDLAPPTEAQGITGFDSTDQGQDTRGDEEGPWVFIDEGDCGIGSAASGMDQLLSAILGEDRF